VQDEKIHFGKLEKGPWEEFQSKAGPWGGKVLSPLKEKDITLDLVSAASAACAEKNIKLVHNRLTTAARIPREAYESIMQQNKTFLTLGPKPSNKERLVLGYAGKDKISKESDDDGDDEGEDVSVSSMDAFGYVLAEFEYGDLGKVAVVADWQPYYIVGRRLNRKQSVDLSDAEKQDEDIYETLCEIAEDLEEERLQDFWGMASEINKSEV